MAPKMVEIAVKNTGAVPNLFSVFDLLIFFIIKSECTKSTYF